MKSIDPTLVDNPWIFPNTDTLNKAFIFMQLTPEQQLQYEKDFQTAIGN